MHKFQVGSTYYTRYIGDSNIKVFFKIICRTEKFAVVKTGKRCRIYLDSNGNEIIYPEGQHSMCLVLRAECMGISKTLKQFALEYNLEPTESAVTGFLIKTSKSLQPYKNLLISCSQETVVYVDFC